MMTRLVWIVVVSLIISLPNSGCMHERPRTRGARKHPTHQAVKASLAEEVNGPSSCPSISGDGRYVAFDSEASNLVPGDTNKVNDVFVHDRGTKKTFRISVDNNGKQMSEESGFAAINGNGRFVAFEVRSGRSVTGEFNFGTDVFVSDLQIHKTTRASVTSDGHRADGINDLPSISADGRFVAFRSSSFNLAPGLAWCQVFIHDRQTGQTTLLSRAYNGGTGDGTSFTTSISATGRYVAFDSEALNIVRDHVAGYPGVYIYDRRAGETDWIKLGMDRVLLDSSSGEPSLSANGRYVAFAYVPGPEDLTFSENYRDNIVVYDRMTAKRTLASGARNRKPGNGESGCPAINADGRYVAFASSSSNLVPGDTNRRRDVFVRDLWRHRTERVSVASDGTQGSNDSGPEPEADFRGISISSDGRYVAFASQASNLVPGDRNHCADIFVHDRKTGKTTRVSVPSRRPR